MLSRVFQMKFRLGSDLGLWHRIFSQTPLSPSLPSPSSTSSFSPFLLLPSFPHFFLPPSLSLPFTRFPLYPLFPFNWFLLDLSPILHTQIHLLNFFLCVSNRYLQHHICKLLLINCPCAQLDRAPDQDAAGWSHECQFKVETSKSWCRTLLLFLPKWPRVPCLPEGAGALSTSYIITFLIIRMVLCMSIVKYTKILYYIKPNCYS